MPSTSDSALRTAIDADVPAIVALVNRAFAVESFFNLATAPTNRSFVS